MLPNRLYTLDQQLWLPLSIAVGCRPAPSSTVAQPAWTDTAIAALHRGLLKRALKQLADPRLRQETRAELLDWVMEAVEPSGVLRPFSFRACVYFLDPALDAETLARQVAYQVRRLSRQRPPAAALHRAA